MRFLRSSWFPLLLGIIIAIVILSEILASSPNTFFQSSYQTYNENELWQAPSEDEIPFDSNGDLIRYGKELIANTSRYLGPKGLVAEVSNNMNCQNCHIAAGTQNFANPFSAVAATYPRYRDRSGRVESVEYRVNDCLQRSMNAGTLDSSSTEMRAMVAYLKWVGKNVTAGLKPKGAGTEALPYLPRAADPQKGKMVYTTICQRCHGSNGEGVLNADSTGYTYPPLWGEQSFNTGAGMYQLSRLAGFVKNNMPFGTTWQNPQVTNEQAWDVAAYVASQQRPQKRFMHDWPDIAKKPVDYPFGPYGDSFSEKQHKYGPFLPITKR
ncbi:MAG TPA: c-type cytochrome [Flavisolibacter sp.]|nr:c-type cytochrome [Flavisolibacter sp.]